MQWSSSSSERSEEEGIPTFKFTVCLDWTSLGLYCGTLIGCFWVCRSVRVLALTRNGLGLCLVTRTRTRTRTRSFSKRKPHLYYIPTNYRSTRLHHFVFVLDETYSLVICSLF